MDCNGHELFSKLVPFRTCQRNSFDESLNLARFIFEIVKFESTYFWITSREKRLFIQKSYHEYLIVY